ncbi:MAG TPA: SDR family oxidoreductase, partial [Tepidisphaeraceae bacterium]|nr:SDR family oxidoreductase [Tepidisphaeraceae bacterium]
SVVADVGIEENVRRIADTAIARFGGFDTWVNNAGASVYGRIEQISNEDHRRLFETNFWGVVYGSQVALGHLKGKGEQGGAGGAIINVGSTVSDRAIPLQGMYSASKHAIKAFTDALRMESEEADYPISFTLIKPAAIDTPYVEHAKNYMEEDPSFPPPVYAAETVARAILHAAVHPERDILVGGGAKFFSLMEKVAPRLTDLMMQRTMFKQQKAGTRGQRSGIGLHRHGIGGEQSGGYEGHVMKTSLYTAATTHPWMTGLILGATGAAVAAAIAAKPAATRKERGWWD